MSRNLIMTYKRGLLCGYITFNLVMIMQAYSGTEAHGFICDAYKFFCTPPYSIAYFSELHQMKKIQSFKVFSS